ncbi:NUDIX domain-containing protein [Puia dinghuensis]|uniref:GDP-mannose pyrophosphatase n=1 Tax=Puia dinghuensis TaxID=1792502 RepID=A0A8J2UC48_9BACT|nr:NUDIX hydrolase [Puia dinghuensis]GGA96628.1 DNA mismatch repair protein MutT [Puia dinghuensis]
MKNPWTVLAERPVYDNKWIGVTEYDVLNPSGGKGIYGKVHFKGLAIGILPLDEEGYTWLVGQYRFPLDAYSWEIPEGGGDFAVSPIESARRELKEETGLVAKEYTLIQEMHLSNSVSDERAFIFLARGLHQEEATPEETEQLVVRRVAFDEAFEMVLRGEITDSIAVAGILKVKLMLMSGALKI